jgi:RNA polymerase sigma-70 factor (ECF subfamily)
MEGSEQPLEDLLVRVGHGDTAAFETIYDQMAGPVYGVILRVVRDAGQAEEVSQEALLEVWRFAARFDPIRGSAVTWIMTIAHRRAVDRVRAVGAAAARERLLAPAEPDRDEVGDSVTARMERERVRRCLEELTDLQRESITLAYYGGQSYRQVASALGVALGTIKSRIRDGLLRMRHCLGEA